MIKNHQDVLADLKALELIAAANIAQLECLQHYTLALASVATIWGVETEFVRAAQQMVRHRGIRLALPATLAGGQL